MSPFTQLLTKVPLFIEHPSYLQKRGIGPRDLKTLHAKFTYTALQKFLHTNDCLWFFPILFLSFPDQNIIGFAFLLPFKSFTIFIAHYMLEMICVVGLNFLLKSVQSVVCKLKCEGTFGGQCMSLQFLLSGANRGVAFCFMRRE